MCFLIFEVLFIFDVVFIFEVVKVLVEVEAELGNDPKEEARISQSVFYSAMKMMLREKRLIQKTDRKRNVPLN